MLTLIRCFFALCILHATPVLAQTLMTFDSCSDAKGRTVAVLADATLKAVVGSGEEGGKAYLRYNAEVLPQLLPESRQFLFAHECARHYLGLPLSGERTLAQAQRADCEAVAMLVRSKLLPKAADATVIEDDLSLVADWSLLPGPPRKLALTQCKPAAETRGGMTLPLAPARSEQWAKCVQACGSKLYACGRAASCQTSYDQCSKSCGE